MAQRIFTEYFISPGGADAEDGVVRLQEIFLHQRTHPWHNQRWRLTALFFYYLMTIMINTSLAQSEVEAHITFFIIL